MKTVIRSALLLTLCAGCLVGCTSNSGKSKKKSGGGGGDTGDVYKDYYMNKKDRNGNNVDDYHLKDTQGEELQKNIHHYLIDQHKTYLRYAQVAKYYPWTDQLEGTSGYENFYTGWIHKDNTATREHMWCCADSNGMWYRNSKQYEWKMDDQKPDGKEEYWGGGSDIFQLRPCTYEVNSHRSNYKYYVFGSGESYDTATDEGAPYALKYSDSAKVCEVDDYFKGDVARTLMYMYVHYNSYDNYDVYYSTSHTPTYNIDEAVAETATTTPYVCAPANGNEKYLHFSLIMNYDETECIRKLKEWNRNDPPSALEQQRNKYIGASIQGNRNPFIDFPELVDKCFPDIN